MKYIVIQGRAPQDGSEARKALILCPRWMSSTLVCAGIVGRVIELTDGNILKEGNVPMSEDEVYTGLLIDGALDRDSQVGSEPLVEPEVLLACAQPTAATDPEDAYRQGMQQTRNQLTEMLSEFAPVGQTVNPGWLFEQLTELKQLRESPSTTPTESDWAKGLEDAEGNPLITIPQSEYAQLQKDQKNLDAWRDAAGRAGLAQEYDDKGFIRKLYLPEQSGGASLVAAVQVLTEQWDEMGKLLEQHGITAQDNRLEWLKAQLSGVSQGELMDSYQALQEDFARTHAELVQRTAQRDALYFSALRVLDGMRNK